MPRALLATISIETRTNAHLQLLALLVICVRVSFGVGSEVAKKPSTNYDYGLQLKPGRSWAEIWTDLRKMSMRVFFWFDNMLTQQNVQNIDYN